MILGDQQVGSAVAIVIAGDDSPRFLELNLVKTNIGGDVLETISPKIAEQTHFTLAVFRFADCDQIDPAIVVIVDGSHTVGADPVRLRELDLIESFAMIVAPEGKRRRPSPEMSKSKIHPAIVIEIQYRNSEFRTRDTLHGKSGFEFPLPWILENSRWGEIAGHDQIDGAVIVNIRSNRCDSRGGLRQASFLGHVGKRSIPIIAKHHIGQRFVVKKSRKLLAWLRDGTSRQRG